MTYEELEKAEKKILDGKRLHLRITQNNQFLLRQKNRAEDPKMSIRIDFGGFEDANIPLTNKNMETILTIIKEENEKMRKEFEAL